MRMLKTFLREVTTQSKTAWRRGHSSPWGTNSLGKGQDQSLPQDYHRERHFPLLGWKGEKSWAFSQAKGYFMSEFNTWSTPQHTHGHQAAPETAAGMDIYILQCSLQPGQQTGDSPDDVISSTQDQLVNTLFRITPDNKAE